MRLYGDVLNWGFVDSRDALGILRHRATEENGRNGRETPKKYQYQGRQRLKTMRDGQGRKVLDSVYEALWGCFKLGIRRFKRCSGDS
jgi:hypothetical protein